MPDPLRSIVLLAATGVRIEARMDAEGALVFSGSDLTAGLRGYDYTFTIPAGQVPAMCKALGGADGADPLEVVEAGKDELLAESEMAWCRSHGIEGTFSSRIKS